MKLIGVKGVQELLDIGRNRALQILNTDGCPVLNRKKNQSYKVFDEDLIRWIQEGGLNE